MLYFSILRWPADLDKAQRTLAAQAALNIDALQATAIARANTPTVVRVLTDPEEAREAIRTLAKIDAPAVAIGQRDLDKIPDPVRAKALHPALGAPKPMYAVEPWRGPGATLVMDQVFLLVRGSIRRERITSSKLTSKEIGADPFEDRSQPYSTLSRLLDAAPEDRKPLSAAPSKTFMVAGQIIDLYQADGSRVRIDADKFNFSVLGDQRSITDRSNTEALALKLAQEATHAILDLGFEKFDPPCEFVRTERTSAGLDNSEIRTTDRLPLFDFYSRWIYLLMRHVGPDKLGPA